MVKRMVTRASLQRPSDRQITIPYEFEWMSDPMNLPNVIIKFPLTEEYNLLLIVSKELFCDSIERAKPKT